MMREVQATVQFDVPAAMRDLSKWGFVEIDLENAGDKPLRFTFLGAVGQWLGRCEHMEHAAGDGPTSRRLATQASRG